MDLEKVNQEYLELKKDLEKAQEEAKKIQEKVDGLAQDKTLAQAEKINAERSGDDVAKAEAEKKIAEVDKELKKIREDASKKKESMEKVQGKIDAVIAKIKTNPEMQQHFEEVLAKKYNRNAMKTFEKYKTAMNDKEKLVEVQKVIEKYPTMKAYLTDLVESKQRKDALVEEITTLDETKKSDKKRIDEIKKETKDIQKKIDKNDLGISEELIGKIIEKGLVKDDKGDLDINATLSKDIKTLDREIKGHYKSLNYHQKALNDMGRDLSFNTKNTPPRMATDPEKEPKTGEGSEPEKDPEPEKKGFFKRIGDWFKKTFGKEVESLPAPDSKAAPATKTEESKRNEFADSLKYDVVRDAVAQLETEKRKEAKQQFKEDAKPKEDKEDERE